MKPSNLALCAVLALAVVPSSLSSADDRRDPRQKRQFTARLAGANEVPPNSTPAMGRLSLVINQDDTEIQFELSWRDLTAVPSAAHVHFGPTKVNGGVMFFFCGGGGQDPCPAETTAMISGTVTADKVVGPAGQGIAAGEFAEVLQALRSNLAYANIHDAPFPGGEIRGAVK
jgi:hypothetical protein